MVKDLKEKLDKYDNEKKGAAKVEKAKREAVASRQEQEKKWAITSQKFILSNILIMINSTLQRTGR